jgi:mono/diheme cytochrome c family protein
LHQLSPRKGFKFSSAKTLAAAAVLVLASASPSFAEGDTSVEAGQVLYNDVGCASCHGENGEGVVAPRLKGSRAINDVPTFVQRILFGGGDMAPFDYLEDAEIAAIANYVRTVINKQTIVVTEADVASAR